VAWLETDPSVPRTVTVYVPAGVGVWMVTVAVPVATGDVAVVAVTVTGPAGAAEGAVYRPLLASIVPLPLPPSTAHVTLVSVVPVTVAVNCWVCVASPARPRLGQRVVTELGLTVTTIGGVEEPLPQATRNPVRTKVRHNSATL